MKKALVHSSGEIGQSENRFWINLLESFEEKLWKISLNLKNGEIICQEIVSYSNGNLLLRNPAINENLLTLLDKVIKSANPPDNEVLNTINALLKKHRKVLKCKREKSKKKPETRGRQVENYLRRATLQVIKRIEPGEKIQPIAKEIYPAFKRRTQSEESFISQVRRLYRQTEIAWKKETQISKVSFEIFAKNRLKPSRRLYKTKPKTNSSK